MTKTLEEVAPTIKNDGPTATNTPVHDKDRNIEIEIHPLGYKCKVLLDGEDVSHLVKSTDIHMDAKEVTTVTLVLYKTKGEPFVIKGKFVEE